MIIDDNGFSISSFKEVSTQFLDGTSSSAQSTAIDSELIRIATLDANVFLEFGTNPTAEADVNMILPKNSVEYFKITKGQKVAVIGGKISISIME